MSFLQKCFLSNVWLNIFSCNEMHFIGALLAVKDTYRHLQALTDTYRHSLQVLVNPPIEKPWRGISLNAP